MKNRLFKIVLSIIVIFTLFITPTFADVGDFESYSSDSSWSSSDSSWSSSDSSWSSSDSSWSYSDRSSSIRGNNYSGKVTAIEIVILLLIGIPLFVGFLSLLIPKHYSADHAINMLQKDVYDVYKNKSAVNDTKSNEVITKIKEKDELFNEEEFKSWASDLFINLQYAWSDRDWEKMRMFETTELFERHASQLNRYKQNGQVNKLERVSVNSLYFLNFYQLGDKEYVSVVLNSKMIDYIVDEKTGNVLRGSKLENKVNNYKLTFVRKVGIKTSPKDGKPRTVECPNCGAPTQITSAGRCSYCRTLIVTNDHDWVLSNLERYYGN